MQPFLKRYERRRLAVLYAAPALMYAGTLLSVLIFLGAGLLFAPAVPLRTEGMLWLQAAAQFAVGMPLCAVCMLIVPADPMERFSMRAADVIKAFLICCFFMIAGSLIGAALGRIPGFPADAGIEEALIGTDIPYQLACIVLAGPFFEELIFRKLLLDRVNRLGDRTAMFISAFLFAAYHCNLQQFFYAFGAGLVFAYIYLRTGKLRYSVIMHMLINLLFGVVPGILLTSGTQNLVIQALAVFLEFGAAAAGLFLLVLERKRIKLLKGWIRMPDGFPGFTVFNAGMPVLAFCFIIIMILNN